MSLTIDTEYNTLVSDAAKLAAFKTEVVSEMARELKKSPSEIQITSLRAGSVIVDVFIEESDPVRAATFDSRIRSGAVSKQVGGYSVKSVKVSTVMPPNTSDSLPLAASAVLGIAARGAPASVVEHAPQLAMQRESFHAENPRAPTIQRHITSQPALLDMSVPAYRSPAPMPLRQPPPSLTCDTPAVDRPTSSLPRLSPLQRPPSIPYTLVLDSSQPDFVDGLAYAPPAGAAKIYSSRSSPVSEQGRASGAAASVSRPLSFAEEVAPSLSPTASLQLPLPFFAPHVREAEEIGPSLPSPDRIRSMWVQTDDPAALQKAELDLERARIAVEREAVLKESLVLDMERQRLHETAVASAPMREPKVDDYSKQGAQLLVEMDELRAKLEVEKAVVEQERQRLAEERAEQERARHEAEIMRNAERVAKLVQEVELKQAGLLRSAEIHHEKERFAPFPLHKPALQPRAPSPNFECSDDDAYWPVQAAAPRSLPSEAPLQHFHANMPTKGALQAEAAALRLTTASVGPPIAREAERAHAEAEQTRATTNHRMLPRPSPASSETLMTHAVDAGGAAPDPRPDRSSPRSTLQRLRTPNRSACKPPPLRSAPQRGAFAAPPLWHLCH